MKLHSTRLLRRLLFAFAILLFAPAIILAAQKQKHPPSGPIDLNSATTEQLQQLPGIGPGTARAIVDFREKSGPFLRVEDLLAVRGVSKAKFEKLRPCVTVTPPRPTH